MGINESAHPVTSIIQRAASEVSYLVRTELRLARTELSAKLSNLATGGMHLGIGAVLALAGFIVLLLAIVRWLEVAGLPNEWGLLLVGGGVILLGVILLLRGTRSMRGPSLVPERTLNQLKADASVIKE